jgi:WD40 repeat protein
MAKKEPAETQYDKCPNCGYPCKLVTYPNEPKTAYAKCERCQLNWSRKEDPTDPKKLIYEKWVEHEKIEVTIPTPLGSILKFPVKRKPKVEPIPPKTPNTSDNNKGPFKEKIKLTKKGKIAIGIIIIIVGVIALSYYMNSFGLFNGITANPTQTPTSTNSTSNTPTSTPVPISARALTIENAAEIKQIGLLDSELDRLLLWSPDGKWLAVANYRIDIYNGSSLELTYTIDTVQWPESIAFSPDSSLLVCSAGDFRGEQGLFAWRTDGWGQVLTKHQIGDAKSLAFSPDGKELAMVIGETVKLWNVSDWVELLTLPCGDATVVAFSPKGNIIAAGGGIAGTDIIIWDAQTGEQLSILEGHTNWIQSIAFAPDGKSLASGSVDKKIILWDMNSYTQIRVITDHLQEITSVAFSPNGQLLASASSDITVRLWNLKTGEQLNSLAGHASRINSVAFSPDGATLASGANDNAVRIWGLP